MSIYAVADLHLSLSPEIDKPMDIYGPRWYDHVSRLRENWCSIINEEDTVIVPGDISWGLKMEDAMYDLEWLAALPGHKVIFKGNHDLWWNSITKLNKMYENMTFVQNDFYLAEDVYICGSRGWLTPDNDDYSQDDEKIYRREIQRLRTSLDKAAKDMLQRYGEKAAADTENPPAVIIGVMHYPPVSKPASFSAFQQAFEDYGVKNVIYGHIHGDDGFRNTIMGNYHGIEYNLVSLDYLNCMPVCIKK